MLLVEFKLLRSFTKNSRDREKLLAILKELKSPVYCEVCAVVEPAKLDLSKNQASAKADGDRWYWCNVNLPLGNGSLSVCARLIHRS
jgi:hypothetical protein